MAATAHAPDRFLVALAALESLSASAARAPLIVLVDDVQWLDRSSRDALAFVARRLETIPILFLMALRDEFRSDVAAGWLPELQIERLDDVSAEALLDASAPRLTSRVRRRILEEALGNPLALVELPTIHVPA
jgi:predicted ATPase